MTILMNLLYYCDMFMLIVINDTQLHDIMFMWLGECPRFMIAWPNPAAPSLGYAISITINIPSVKSVDSTIWLIEC